MITTLGEICKQNCYKQLDADSLENLIDATTYDIKLLPSSKNYNWFTTQELGNKYVCDGEVITLGKARYANIKYWNGKFISSNNNIIESINQEILKTKYLFYFLSKTSKDYYVESTSYPKFDQSSFNNHKIYLPEINVQIKRTKILDNLYARIKNEQTNINNLDILIKSRFIEMFGDYKTNSMNLPIVTPCEICESIIAGGDRPLEVSKEKTKEFCYPIYSNGEKDSGLYGWSKDYKITKPSVTISARGTIGYSSYRKEGKFTPIVRLIVLIPNKKINPIYLTYFMNFERESGSGSGVKQLTVPMIKEKNVILPSLINQNKFATFVELIDKLKFNAQQRIKLYQELLDKKMDEYFN